MALTSIFGGNKSAEFDPSKLDLLWDRGGLLRERGNTIAYDTFDNASFDGWVNHWGYDQPYPPIGLTDHVAWGGSSHSMVISPATSDITGVSTRHDGGYTFRRLGRWFPDGITSISALIAVTGSGSVLPDIANPVVPYTRWGLCFDSQRDDNTSRDFPQLMYMDRGVGQKPAWHVRVVDADHAVTWRVIPGTADISAGLNEYKYNPNYVRLSFDWRTRKYVEAQVNNLTFDLRSILQPGETAFDILLNNQSWDHFSSGFNGGILGDRNMRFPGENDLQLVVGQVWMTANDRSAY